MALDPNSYGTVTGVAALTPRNANSSGTFDATTRPALTRVEAFIDQVSAALNSILAQNGFVIPVTQASVVRMLNFFVEEEVASIVEGLNGFGRFGPNPERGGRPNMFSAVRKDVEAFVESNAVGMERLGATRNYSLTAGIAFRDTDESGASIEPLFQRKAFGNAVEDWDS